MSTSKYLDKFLDTVSDAFTPKIAQRIVNLRVEDPELLNRIEQLRAKANEGELSSEEEAEYKEYVEAVDVISLLQAKARRHLVKH